MSKFAFGEISLVDVVLVLWYKVIPYGRNTPSLTHLVCYGGLGIRWSFFKEVYLTNFDSYKLLFFGHLSFNRNNKQTAVTNMTKQRMF